MGYTFEQLKEDVMKEAEGLRVHATSEELGHLEAALLRPTDARYCIYGLMCNGDCYSQRAAELIDKCAISHFDMLPDTVEELDAFITDKPKDFLATRIDQMSNKIYSAIEAYIQLPGSKNANLIAYLRGETETLEL